MNLKFCFGIYRFIWKLYLYEIVFWPLFSSHSIWGSSISHLNVWIFTILNFTIKLLFWYSVQLIMFRITLIGKKKKNYANWENTILNRSQGCADTLCNLTDLYYRFFLTIEAAEWKAHLFFVASGSLVTQFWRRRKLSISAASQASPFFLLGTCKKCLSCSI